MFRTRVRGKLTTGVTVTYFRDQSYSDSPNGFGEAQHNDPPSLISQRHLFKRLCQSVFQTPRLEGVVWFSHGPVLSSVRDSVNTALAVTFSALGFLLEGVLAR